MPQPKNSKKGIYAKYQEYILEIKIQKVHLWQNMTVFQLLSGPFWAHIIMGICIYIPQLKN